MPTNEFPNVGFSRHDRANYFKKISVTSVQFGDQSVDGYQPVAIIHFVTQGFILLNEGTGVVEYSFDGINVHGELDSASTYTKMLRFDHRVVSKIWMRVKSGSAGPITVSIQAWA